MDRIVVHCLIALEMENATLKITLEYVTMMEEIAVINYTLEVVFVQFKTTIECVNMTKEIVVAVILPKLVMVFAMMKTTMANVPLMAEIVAYNKSMQFHAQSVNASLKNPFNLLIPVLRLLRLEMEFAMMKTTT